jgi:hypothetical protein
MYLVYVDDSRDAGICIFSALLIPSAQWKTSFAAIKEYRRELKQEYGIFMSKEFHATEFVSGHGRISDRVVFKGTRCRIFRETLERVARLPHAQLINAVMPIGRETWAFERLLNRINRTMLAWNSQAIMLCDEGKESIYTRLARKMGVFNPIPSDRGDWGTGQATRNIPLDRILEDPIFKKSHSSYFIQMADFCAYSLLRREVQLESKNRYGLHECFASLSPILFRGACRSDPEGIIR